VISYKITAVYSKYLSNPHFPCYKFSKGKRAIVFVLVKLEKIQNWCSRRKRYLFSKKASTENCIIKVIVPVKIFLSRILNLLLTDRFLVQLFHPGAICKPMLTTQFFDNKFSRIFTAIKFGV